MTRTPDDEREDDYNPTLEQALFAQPRVIPRGPARDNLLVGKYVYIVSNSGDNAGNWSQESPYRVVAIDEHGIWLQAELRLRLNGERTKPIRLMRWPSTDYYTFDLIDP